MQRNVDTRRKWIFYYATPFMEKESMNIKYTSVSVSVSSISSRNEGKKKTHVCYPEYRGDKK